MRWQNTYVLQLSNLEVSPAKSMWICTMMKAMRLRATLHLVVKFDKIASISSILYPRSIARLLLSVSLPPHCCGNVHCRGNDLRGNSTRISIVAITMQHVWLFPHVRTNSRQRHLWSRLNHGWNRPSVNRCLRLLVHRWAEQIETDERVAKSQRLRSRQIDELTCQELMSIGYQLMNGEKLLTLMNWCRLPESRREDCDCLLYTSPSPRD